MIMAAHRDELVAFFTGAESASGLVSSWTALVGIALGGAGGSRDPESRITDRRFHLGPAGETAISRSREVRAALVQLTPRQQEVLFALHGPVAWSKYLDAVFGKGMGVKVTAKLGDLIGVALLTDAVAEGFAKASAPAKVSARLRRPQNPGGWLVQVCLKDATRLAVVRDEARKLVSDAEAAYADKRGVVAAERAPRVRRPSWDPFALPGEAS
jgi:hypothetical protein